jgi:hypothetical protein
VLGLSQSAKTSITNWYDPATNLMHIAPKMIVSRNEAGLCVVIDRFVFAMGGVDLSDRCQLNVKCSVEMLDVSSSSLLWIPKVSLLVSRKAFGVGVLDNSIYAVSHANKLVILCFKINTICFVLHLNMLDWWNR